MTALAELTKAGYAAEFSAGSRSGIAGGGGAGHSLPILCQAARMWEATPAVQRAREPVSPGSLVSPSLDGCGLCLAPAARGTRDP